MPVVVIPLLASLIVGLLMFLLLGRPLAAITSGLTNWLGGLSGGSVLILRIILGLMMCFDLGGPVNKAAYAFATAGTQYRRTGVVCRIMAAVMAAGMVPRWRWHWPPRCDRVCSASPNGRTDGRPGPGSVVHLRGRDPVRRGPTRSG